MSRARADAGDRERQRERQRQRRQQLGRVVQRLAQAAAVDEHRERAQQREVQRQEADADERQRRDVLDASVQRSGRERVEGDAGEHARDGRRGEVDRQHDEPVALDGPGAELGEHGDRERAGRPDERDGQHEADEGRRDLKRPLPFRCAEHAREGARGQHSGQRETAHRRVRRGRQPARPPAGPARRRPLRGGASMAGGRHGETLRPPRERLRTVSWRSRHAPRATGRGEHADRGDEERVCADLEV